MSDRMSPLGSIMWGVGQDATLRMIVGNLIVLDRTPTRSALAERLGVVARSRATAAPAAEWWIGRPNAGVDRRRVVRSRQPHSQRGCRVAWGPASGPRSGRVARADTVRPEHVAMGYHRHRWVGRRPSGALPTGAPFAHGRITRRVDRALDARRICRAPRNRRLGGTVAAEQGTRTRQRRRHLVSAAVSAQARHRERDDRSRRRRASDRQWSRQRVCGGAADRSLGRGGTWRATQPGRCQLGLTAGRRDGRADVAVVALALDQHSIRDVVGARGARDCAGAGWQPQRSARSRVGDGTRAVPRESRDHVRGVSSGVASSLAQQLGQRWVDSADPGRDPGRKRPSRSVVRSRGRTIGEISSRAGAACHRSPGVGDQPAPGPAADVGAAVPSQFGRLRRHLTAVAPRDPPHLWRDDRGELPVRSSTRFADEHHRVRYRRSTRHRTRARSGRDREAGSTRRVHGRHVRRVSP